MSITWGSSGTASSFLVNSARGMADRGALLRLRRLRGVELPVAQFDAANSLVPGNVAADMVVRHFECNGD